MGHHRPAVIGAPPEGLVLPPRGELGLGDETRGRVRSEVPAERRAAVEEVRGGPRGKSHVSAPTYRRHPGGAIRLVCSRAVDVDRRGGDTEVRALLRLVRHQARGDAQDDRSE